MMIKMLSSFKNLSFSLALLAIIFSFGVAPALADCTTNASSPQAAAQCGINGGSGTTTDAGTATNGIQNTITIILNTLSVVVGIVAVIMIIVAGLRYVTSGGSEQGVKSAKSTLLYAIIGLVIVAVAQVLVHFVLKTTNTAVKPPG